jgi:predicted ATPase
MTPRLTHVRVAGFRSARDVHVDLGPVTVLIGPNGSGKSNLLAALTLVHELTFERLQLFASRRGGASNLMHYGPQRTRAVEIDLVFATAFGQFTYEARLGYGADESLIFLDERTGGRKRSDEPWQWHEMGAGHRESLLRREADEHRGPHWQTTPGTVYWLMRQINFYHFHDTSTTSPLRTNAKAEDDQYLRSDGSNLPTFLLSLRDSGDPSWRAAWNRIQGLVGRVAPCVRRIQPVVVAGGAVRLDWVDDQGETFGPSLLSDGTLRAMALVTALAQPAPPLLTCIDEPELGLHPAALNIVCGLIKSVAAHRQVIVATQSPALLDEFGPEEVVVVERKDGATELRHLDPKALEAWLDDYSLSELYDKNVFGGRP